MLGSALNGGSFGDCFSAGIKGGIFGGMSAMATTGIGDIFGGVGTIASGKFNILNELGRAGAHSLAQGGIALLREDDFWQGAAAGAFGSFGGSFSGAAGITDFAGIVGVSTVMGGVGSVIAGARSPEEILFGMATGAVVGALNHWPHHTVFIKNKEAAYKYMISLRKSHNRIGFVPLGMEEGQYGAYQMANYRAEIRVDGDQSQISVFAGSSNTEVSDGDVVFNASATLSVNGVTIDNKPLVNGFAKFNLPNSQNVVLIVRGGWTVRYDYGGAAVPVYHPIFWPFSLNFKDNFKLK